MQFYIIDPDPKVNAKQLPDYALKRVNIREGWQMLSDIGHAVDVTWEGQNNEYNRYHPNTYIFWMTNINFLSFLQFYDQCLIEYSRRFGRELVFHERFQKSLESFRLILDRLPCDDSYKSGHATIRYLLDRKRQHLSEEEIKKLEEKLR